MRVILFALALLAAPQGRPCAPDKRCPTPYQCVITGNGHSSCEQLCAPEKKGTSGGCPEDQRCMKDGAHYICRPITDI